MYPQAELIRLAAHKAALGRGIARRRRECIEAAAHAAQPLAWLDRVLALWRRWSPLAALPLGMLVTRTFLPRRGILGAVGRWGPFVFGAVRRLRSALRGR